ncbi:conserved hypothetical protein [Thermoanaerobacter mathranii subsp. mathranii str. A3]|uniref:Relaxase/mobilization nuclease family protein n=1 Tax=Thermoanaerobacter mathranii subsp. mathranii (strain DSM 11426 / CCUG 53645 / CIP 108742 / A3) TaxID=583358 RepID=A0ABM5LME5_THEM3|nr:MobP3 family relaxase [Thermoanaerobacter mathranii]ADH59863.1 conserved hypothetical protein [Thermoanaerobacter mathranii subsp. mathranii str. A3]
MSSPFVMKIAFYTPTAKNQARNSAHVQYIATRPGADRGELSIGDELEPDTPEWHTKYMHERPGSHGLFTAEEEMPDLGEVQKELKNHNGIVWRMVLSLREDDAVRLGYTTRESWEKVLRAVLPEAAAKMGILESNLRWAAAFHQVQGHPHVHVILWEKEPKRLRGVLSQGERRDIRKIFIREIYAKERMALTAEKSAVRDLIRDTAKRDISELLKEVKKARIEIKALNGEKPGLPPTLDQTTREELLEKLKELSKIMPQKGRIAFAYMPEEVKEKAKEIADWLLKQPGFSQSVERYMELAKELASHYTSNPEALEKAAEKAYEDIQKRTAQIVLKGAAALQEEKTVDTTRLTNSVWRSAWRALERERLRAEAESTIAAQKEMEKRRMAERRGESREV